MVVGADGQLPLPWLAAPLAAALAHQRAHAVLVHAAPGIGALPFVVTLAQAWLCEAAESTSPRPCGRCSSCKLVQARVHPDLIVLLPRAMRDALGWPLAGDKADDGDGDGSKNKRKPSKQIRIEEVRSAIDWVYKTSSRGRGKVLVLHPADAMNMFAANALLKTLEEPPPGTRLLLSAGDPEHLLPTVRSRCQLLRLQSPSTEVSRQWLAGQGCREPEGLLAAAGGRPLDALMLAEAGIDAGAWAALPQALARGQGAALASWPVPRLVDALQKLCVDAMTLAAGGAPRYFPSSALPPAARLDRLADWGRSLARIARHDEHPWNEGLLLDALLVEAREALTPARAAGRALDARAASRAFDRLGT